MVQDRLISTRIEELIIIIISSIQMEIKNGLKRMDNRIREIDASLIYDMEIFLKINY